MKIKVLGPNCKICNALEQRTTEAIESLRIDATVEKIENRSQIEDYCVLHTPSLVVDGEVILQGRVPTVERIKEILQTTA